MTDSKQTDENDQPGDNSIVQWWLYALGTTLMWARLRELEAGTAEVLDCDGQTLVYENADTARAALMDAEYRELDGLDEDDAHQMGLDLDELEPPHAEDDEGLRPQMVRAIPER